MRKFEMLTVLWHLLSLSNSNIQFNDQGPGASHRGEPFDRNLLKNILSHPSGDNIIQQTGEAFCQKSEVINFFLELVHNLSVTNMFGNLTKLSPYVKVLNKL